MKKEYIYAIISILLWSTTATVTKLLLGNLDSMQILVVGSFFAFVFLFMINLIKGDLKQLKDYKIKDYIQIAGIGLLGTFFCNLFLYLGINKMHASQAFIINYLWPIMTVIFACAILKERLTFRKTIAILLSFVGVMIVTSNGNLLNNVVLKEKLSIYSILGLIIIIIGIFIQMKNNEKSSKNV